MEADPPSELLSNAAFLFNMWNMNQAVQGSGAPRPWRYLTHVDMTPGDMV